MDPTQQQPESLQPIKARVSSTEIQPPQTANVEFESQKLAQTPVTPDPRPYLPPRPRWQAALLVAFLLGLVALATWGFLYRRSEEPSTASDILPKDSVALINSTTPIPQRNSPLTVRDAVGEVEYAPESRGWTQAIRDAHQAQEEGRYTAAISQFAALTGSSDVHEAHDALWGLASAYESAGNDELAKRTLSLFTYLRDDPRAARAYFRLGQLQSETLSWYDAAQSYDEYTRHGGPASHAVMVLRARLLGNTPDAEEAYKEVIEGNPQDADLRAAILGLAQVSHALESSKASSGDAGNNEPTPSNNYTQTESLKLYDRLANEQQNHPRPALDHIGDPPQVLAAEELESRGDKVGARKRLLDYINSKQSQNYPYGRFSALQDLLRMDPTAVVSGTIRPMAAAKIAYEAGYYGRAIGFMDTLRTLSNDPVERAEAALLTGKAFESSGDAANAYNWYTATVQTYPNSPQAPQAIRRAGDMLVEQAGWDAAQGTYKQAIEQYPNATETDTARLNAALLAYRLEQRDAAIELLSPLQGRETLSPTLKAEVAFWAGKLDKSRGGSGWKESLQKVSNITPGTYLDFRTQSLVRGEPDSGPVAPTFTESQVLTSSLGIHYSEEANERRELLDWATNLASKTLSATTATAALSDTKPTAIRNPQFAIETLSTEKMESRLAKNPEVQRAVALLRLGYEKETYTAMRTLAERLREEGDASGLAQLAIYLRYNAVPRTAMHIAGTLAAMDDKVGGEPLMRPRLLLKTLYPTPYSELVLSEASKQQIDPLVVYALIRQESEFVPAALSHADAMGLTQVIPSTGEFIAEQLGDDNFSSDDLYIPHISIEYGTYYLASNLPQFDRKLLPTLAAYNGGPGNAERWMAGSALLDPDLYVERIDLFETADYLERVYANYGYYRLLYGR